MRLGRPFAAISVGAALVGASLVATPAVADESNGSFEVDKFSNVLRTNQTLELSGTGCTGQNAEVAVALAAPGQQELPTPVTATPAADGTWKATLNVADFIKTAGVDPSTDGWSILAGCANYQGDTDTKIIPVVFDDTEVTGKYTITGEAGAQVINIEIGGFTPGETAKASILSKDGEHTAATLGEFTIDEKGNATHSFNLPSLPDGTYQLSIVGSRYGETAISRKLIEVSGGKYVPTDQDNTDGKGGDGSVGADPSASANPAPGAANGTGATVSVTAGAANAAPARGGDSALARTGTNALIFGGSALALMAVGGGALWARRRKAS